MKEATGELNMTVVTVVAIAAVMAFFYAFVWPTIRSSLQLNTACSTAGGGTYSDTKNGITCANGVCTIEETGQSKNCLEDSASGNGGGD